MRGLLPILAAGVAATLLTGCIRDPDPIAIDEDAIAIHAVLEAGSDSVLVSIARADFSPIAGAEVRIVHGADTAWAVEREEGAGCVRDFWPGDPADPRGCYRAILTAPIAAGGMYRLEVRLPDGRTVTGETVVAQWPEITSPAPLERVPVDCFDEESCYAQSSPQPPYIAPVGHVVIAWRRPDDADVTRLRLVARAVYLDGVDHGPVCSLGYSPGTTTRLAPDSIRWGITGISCGGELQPGRFDSIRADVVVTALNPTYASYIEAVGEGSSVRAEAVSRGVSGAYGVFGAVSPARRAVMLVRQ